MEKQYAPSAKEKKVTAKKADTAAPIADIKVEDKKTEIKTEEKKEEKKTKKEEKVIKEVAVVRGSALPISKKYSMCVCDMIKGKTPDRAVEMLEEVILMKRAVPMNWMEVPHRKGNIMAGRYPKGVAKEFINLVKQLKANSSVNGIDNPVITIAKADKASRPYRRGGVRAKRTHVYMEARDKTKFMK